MKYLICKIYFSFISSSKIKDPPKKLVLLFISYSEKARQTKVR
jgi:hypothetical protein